MVVRNYAERSRQLHTYMRTNLEEIQRTEQTDAALTKIKARGEQRIECWSGRRQFARSFESLRGWSSCKCAADEIAQRSSGRPYVLADQPARRRVWARHQSTRFRTRQFWAVHRESAIGWSVLEG